MECAQALGLHNFNQQETGSIWRQMTGQIGRLMVCQQGQVRSNAPSLQAEALKHDQASLSLMWQRSGEPMAYTLKVSIVYLM